MISRNLNLPFDMLMHNFRGKYSTLFPPSPLKYHYFFRAPVNLKFVTGILVINYEKIRSS